MARTAGHGNPSWTRDETILALGLYLEVRPHLPGPNDVRVKALSDLLRRYPFHSDSVRQPSFRNADGVAFKLQNIRNAETGGGLSNISKMDRAIWAEFGSRPEEAKILAEVVRSAILSQEPIDSDEAELETFVEGQLITRIHKIRERNRRLRAMVLADQRKCGVLQCQSCGMASPASNPSFDDAIFEVHHGNPPEKAVG